MKFFFRRRIVTSYISELLMDLRRAADILYRYVEHEKADRYVSRSFFFRSGGAVSNRFSHLGVTNFSHENLRNIYLL